MLANLSFREQGKVSEEFQSEASIDLAKTLELIFRQTLAMHWPVGSERARSYFVNRESYADGLVVVSEDILRLDGSLHHQHFLLTNTQEGWRIVALMKKSVEGWKLLH